MTLGMQALAVAVLLSGPASAARAPLVYVALGDSTAVGLGGGPGRGYPDRLARRLRDAGVPVELVNMGENGATAADLRRSQLPRLRGARAALVTLCVGINDVVRERDVRDFAIDLEAIATAIERTGARVVVSALPDVSRSPSGALAPASLAPRLDEFNAAIRRVARRHGWAATDVDLAGSAGTPVPEGALFAEDGFHPSARGYERWADAMWPAIERALAPALRERGRAR